MLKCDRRVGGGAPPHDTTRGLKDLECGAWSKPRDRCISCCCLLLIECQVFVCTQNSAESACPFSSFSPLSFLFLFFFWSLMDPRPSLAIDDVARLHDFQFCGTDTHAKAAR